MAVEAEPPPVAVTPEVETSTDMELDKLTDSEVPRDGNLRYVLTVTGVDTAELREELRDSLTDSKFLWDIETIMKSIVRIISQRE